MNRVTEARVVDDDGEAMADAAIFEGGPIFVKWRTRYFPEGERTEYQVTTRYATVQDVEQGTSGTVEVDE